MLPGHAPNDTTQVFIKRLSRYATCAALLSSMTGCVQLPSKAPAHISQESALKRNAAPGPSPTAKQPEPSPEEMGRRFLALVDGWSESDGLSAELVDRFIQIPMVASQVVRGGYATIRLQESGWRYSFSYSVHQTRRGLTNAHLEFYNPTDDRADMEPVCGMDFNAYVAQLEGMGFVEQKDLAQYDSPMPPPRYDPEIEEEIGYEERRFVRIPTFIYHRGSIGVMMDLRREADAPEAKLRHACVASITVGATK